jgi:hypothetical protein
MERPSKYKTFIAFCFFALLLLQPLAQDRVARRPIYPSASFSPSDIAGLILWLKADAITGLSPDDPVATWSDSGGLGNDATQATSSKRPTYKTSIQNGLPVVRFDSVDDGMTTGASASLPFTVFVVYNYRSATSGVHRAVQGASANWLIGPYTNHHQLYNGAFIPTNGSISAVVENVFALVCGLQSSGDAKLFINGVQSGTNTQNGAPGTIYLGHGIGPPPYSETLDGDIAEVIVYDSALGTTNRQSIETYLNGKWAIF